MIPGPLCGDLVTELSLVRLGMMSVARRLLPMFPSTLLSSTVKVDNASVTSVSSGSPSLFRLDGVGAQEMMNTPAKVAAHPYKKVKIW